MTLFEALVMAVIQGVTEFLPVSSSGHLVLAGAFFDILSENSFTLILVTHVATGCAALVFYRRDIGGLLRGVPAGEKDSRRLLLLLAAATTVTAVLGLSFRPFFESLYRTPRTVAPGLFLTGALLMATSFLAPGRGRLERVPLWKALLVGLVQTLAIVPGISRSGATIAAGLFLGLRREEAVRFSFLLLIPATAGAALVETSRISSLGGGLLLQSVAGFFTAALVGYASILLVRKWTGSGRLWYFGLYCWVAAAVAVLSGRVG
jgi:undecaprenyl-diphosphatase